MLRTNPLENRHKTAEGSPEKIKCLTTVKSLL